MKKILFINFVCVFVLSNPALADIVYSGSQNITVGVDAMGVGTASLTIDIAGVADTWDDFTVTLDTTVAMMSMSPTSFVVTGSDLALNLPPTTLIGSGSNFSGGLAILSGEQFPPGGGYIGLRMDPPDSSPFVGVDVVYGWLHMSGMSDIGLPTMSATFDGWAYDKTGAPIAAGAVPVPGAFLLGSIGLGYAGWLCKRLRV